MKLSDFTFHLPDEQIAQYPLTERAASRLLCLDSKTGNIEHKSFRDLLDLISPGDLLVFNNTRVIPARLFGTKETGGKLEILIERILDDKNVLAFIRASKSPKPSSKIILENNIEINVEERQEDLFKLNFNESVLPILNDIGNIPLPPYITREPEESDLDRYQTIYAKVNGAVAAPTAGLHFDEQLIKQIKEKGVNTGFLTLHVGAGTFMPIRVENVKEHKMHSEYVEVSKELCEQIKATKKRGNKVIAVGTTTVRSLESATKDGEFKAFTGETDIFIYPGFQFQCVDAMVTNFHLPESTLLLLVSAIYDVNLFILGHVF